MAVSFGLNLDSLKIRRSLDRSTNNLGSVYEKLSSGLRINKASDDAAGLAVSTTLTNDSRVYTQAIRNTNDGISLLNIAEGALQEVSGITNRLFELTEQSANGVYSTKQRLALDSEADQLVKEFNRITGSTSFNNLKVLNGSISSGLSIQQGYGTNESLSITVGSKLQRTVGDGTFQNATSYSSLYLGADAKAVDVNNDGNLDLIVSNYGAGIGSISILLGNGNSTFKAEVTYFSGALDSQQIVYKDLNNDGIGDVVTTSYDSPITSVLLGNSNGSFKKVTTYSAGLQTVSLALDDINGDNIADIVQGDTGDGVIGIMIGNGDGTFKARTSIQNFTSVWTDGIKLSDVNNDGFKDIIAVDGFNTGVDILLGNGNGTFKVRTIYNSGGGGATVSLGDFNSDGYQDLLTSNYDDNSLSVLLGNSDGSFKAKTSFSVGVNPTDAVAVDINGDGYLDILSTDHISNTANIFLGNGNGTFQARVSYATGFNPNSVDAADLNGDGALEIFTTNSGATISVFSPNTQSVTSIAKLDLTTQSSSRASLSVLTGIQQRIQSEIGQIGASQSRLGISLSVIGAKQVNYSLASSRITDVDVAEASASLLGEKIKQSVSASLLAQANQSPKIALSLLQNI